MRHGPRGPRRDPQTGFDFGAAPSVIAGTGAGATPTAENIGLVEEAERGEEKEGEGGGGESEAS